ncbi:hypothetical protein JKF63_01802 [Porcisia hertigi]|uniref:Uncharacterized protein n=1 Tax=Porcisia hertigi TaxID=2761500 RepID=A0A836L4A5_9TRYP|nr:hypothetical protein JKF63_01802 [Porcisia hertigi]
MATLFANRTDAMMPVHEMPMDQLQREYVSLKSTAYSLTVEESHLIKKIETLREESVRAVLKAEMKEENASNQLFRCLDGAEKEVQHYQSLLKEEESEAESLSNRIKEMRAQQTEVENTLEERQEYLLMNLQRKLLDMARKKTAVEQELMAERQKYLDVLATGLGVLRGRAAASSTESSVAVDPQAASLEASAVPAEKHVDIVPLTTSVSSTLASRRTMDTSAGIPQSTASPEPSAQGDTDPAAATQFLHAPTSVLNAQTMPKESLGVHTLRGSANSIGNRISTSTTPRSADPTPCSTHSSEPHHAVVRLERKLNQLLLEQAAAMQRTSTTEKQCALLTAKLRAVQEATFLDRARAAKMKEELEKARARLCEEKANSTDGTSLSSFDDSSVVSGRSVSLDHTGTIAMGNLSLRERTRELLSSVPSSGMN